MTIRPGDLVMVVRPTLCCGSTRRIGHTFAVLYVDGNTLGECRTCGKWYRSVDAVYRVDDRGNSWAEPLSRLIRIDPLSEPESVTQEVGVGAWESAQKCRRLSLIG